MNLDEIMKFTESDQKNLDHHAREYYRLMRKKEDCNRRLSDSRPGYFANPSNKTWSRL